MAATEATPRADRQGEPTPSEKRAAGGPPKKKGQRLKALIKQADPPARAKDIEQLFKNTADTLKLLGIDDDPNDDIVMALRKIEGRLHHLKEEKEHLTKNFKNLGLDQVEGVLHIDAYIKKKADELKQKRLE